MAKPTPEQRFWMKVDRRGDDDCWIWNAVLNRPNGYGVMRLSNPRRNVYAHRFAYSLLVGPIPDGMHIDHLCRVRQCVNPRHMQLVTPTENTRRARPAMQRAGATRRSDTCGQGHAFDGVVSTTGMRYCKTCRRENMRAQRLRKAAT